jgi:apolipoprotein N-acyltransferase
VEVSLARSWGLALLSGALLAFSFPSFLAPRFPAAAGALAFIALAPLLLAVDGRRPRQALALGFGAGLLFFGASLYWVCYVRPMGPLASAAWLALSAYLALYPALFAGLAAAGLGRRLPLPLLWLPALWTLLEALRGIALGGFPWLGLGHSQYQNAWLLPLAASAGAASLHFACAASGALLFLLLSGRRQGLWPCLALLLLLLALLRWAGLAAEARPQQGRQVRVAVAQASLDQDQAWTLEYQQRLLSAYGKLSRQAASQGAQAVLWPEATLPGILADRDPSVQAFRYLAKGLKVDLISGVYDKDAEGRLSNCMALASSQGSLQSYAKRHLVPFGEYVPLRRLLPFVDQAVRRFGSDQDFTPGASAQPLAGQAGRAGALVCYESVFPGLAADEARLGAEWLAVSTFDTWYGHSAGPYQHASLAVFRAVEQGLWLARAGATGVSLFVAPDGRITQWMDLDQAGILVQDIELRRACTPYARYGDWFLGLCVLLLALPLFWREKQPH